MNRVQFLTRLHYLKKLQNVSSNAMQKPQFSSKSSSSSSSSSSSDDEKKAQQKKKSQEALTKLNNLLLTMTGEEAASSKSKLTLAQPINKRQKAKVEKPKPENAELKIEKAAKEVAETFGGDVQKTQSELIMKLLNLTDSPTTNANLKDVVQGMKIDQEKASVLEGSSKAELVNQVLSRQPREPGTKTYRPRPPRATRSDSPPERVDLFMGESLGIFTEDTKNHTEGVENNTWNLLHQRDLKLAVTHPPSNYFQQLILWTEQGKIWKFPIDNEQDIQEEKQVYFTEHVFLEKHLEPWCPPKGPLRHFMELVCVGLSKNPYLTVEAKKEHIDWYRKYFEDKQKLLKETGVLQKEFQNNEGKPKQIE